MDHMLEEGARIPLEAWFWEMPVCTRWWTTATILISVLVQCRILGPYQLFYSFQVAIQKSQVRTPPAGLPATRPVPVLKRLRFAG